MKKITILGSTGSIGTQTLSVVRENPRDFEVVALSAGSNAQLIEEQIREFHPRAAVMADEAGFRDLKRRVADLPVKVSCGMAGLIEIAMLPEIDLLVTALVGMIGIRPTLAAIEAGKDIALANKETLVCAGHLIMPLVKEKGARLLPVDSEHSAIFQVLNGEERKSLNKIILTASGGPFRGMEPAQLAKATPAQALKHPNWSMGAKITIDSATMINKGLEVIEAGWLFGLAAEKIEVVVHPQSIVHSLVEFIDGSVLAQMGLPDMRLPIAYALFYPHRKPVSGRRLDLKEIGSLTFDEPEAVFRGLALAYLALEKGGSAPTVYNAANEAAVALFLQGKIGFLEIYELIGEALERHEVIGAPTVDDILMIEEEVKGRIG